MENNTSLAGARQLDLIKEMVNIGIGHAAASLNSLTNSHIELSLPEVEIVNPQELVSGNSELFCKELSYVHLGFRGLFSGTAMLAFPTEGAVKLVSTLTGEDTNSSSLDAIMAGTLNEVGNIIINSVIGSICNLLNQSLDFSLPDYVEGKLSDLMLRAYGNENIAAVVAYINFVIESLEVTGNIVLIFELPSLKNFIALIDGTLKTNEFNST